MKTAIFDIDGTLANNSHRQYLVRRNTPAWDEFFLKMGHDTPNQPIICLYQSIKQSGHFSCILVSGRPNTYRERTEEWLEKYGIEFDHLYMREIGDKRPDVKVKKEILDALLAKGHEICFVVDDRNDIVRMWRENGITCLQCADHNY